MHSMIAQLPDYVQRAVADLASEPATQSIWLIGSRASSTARPSSDWDLLVFSADEPRERDRRCDELDVVHVGPSGHFLAEGQPVAGFTLSFANWEWREAGDQAIYTGYDLLGETDDYEGSSPVRRPQRSAVRIWLAPTMKRLDLPPLLLRAFAKRAHAEIFLGGRIRLLERRCYRVLEDSERGDSSEGAAGWIVPGANNVSVTAGSQYMNPVYVLCMSRPEVDLAHLIRKGPYVVSILDSHRLFERLASALDHNTFPDGRKCFGIDSGSVAYEKGELASALPSDEERTRMSYLQKPAHFRRDAECRIGILVSGPISTASDELWVQIDATGLFASYLEGSAASLGA
jgi:hypothetical protein